MWEESRRFDSDISLPMPSKVQYELRPSRARCTSTPSSGELSKHGDADERSLALPLRSNGQHRRKPTRIYQITNMLANSVSKEWCAYLWCFPPQLLLMNRMSDRWALLSPAQKALDAAHLETELSLCFFPRDPSLHERSAEEGARTHRYMAGYIGRWLGGSRRRFACGSRQRNTCCNLVLRSHRWQKRGDMIRVRAEAV